MRNTIAPFSVAALVVAFAGSLTAQNLIRNGEFNSLANWQRPPTVINPRIASSKVTGAPSNSLFFEHLAGSRDATITQTVKLAAQPYRLRCFVGADVPAGSRIDYWIAVTNDKTKQQHIGSPAGWRNFSKEKEAWTHVFDLTPWRAIVAGDYTVQITFRYTGTALTRTTAHLDRVELLPLQLPATAIDRVWTTPRNPAVFRAAGQRNALMVMFLALGRLPRPVPIPNLGGMLEIDPSSALLFASGPAFGGRLDVRVPNWPQVLRCVPFYLETVQFDPATLQGTIGMSSMHAIR